MARFKLQLSYDGTDFKGWQKQKARVITVQGCLEQALKKIFHRPISSIGAGRTDAGVHARQQVCHFDVQPQELKPVLEVQNALNALTPDSLSVHKVQAVPQSFHALHSCRMKTYKYTLQNTHVPDARVLRFSHHIRTPLDLTWLNRCAKILVGTHDFKSFQTQGTQLKSTVRQVYKSHWQKKPFGFLVYTICGQGFLKQMVRNIVGTQLDLFRHHRPPTHIQKILKARDRRQALGTAPAKGLCLWRVHY